MAISVASKPTQAPETTGGTQPAGGGGYKDVTATSYNEDLELKGGNGFSAAKNPLYLPTWNKSDFYPPLEPFKHEDVGKRADPSLPNLLPPEAVVTNLTPSIGTEVQGIQLSQLTDKGKDELALFVAQRKAVVFRNQDLGKLSPGQIADFAGYFGRHHVHPTGATPAGHPEVLVVFRGAGDKPSETVLKDRLSSVAWHSDVTYEEQPPGTTFLAMLEKPEVGGDTPFVDAAQAYQRLSPAFQKRLHGLRAVHSGIEQVEATVKRGIIKRRDAVATEHPIVRTHPVTGEKALFVNPQFTRYIVGLKQEESEAILQFLYQHIAAGADFQTRVRWEEDSVVVWDNRVTLHTALVDWSTGSRRHLIRLTPQAERPFETPFDSQ